MSFKIGILPRDSGELACMQDLEREKILLERDRILNKVKEYIDSNLNPRKANIIDPSLDDYIEPPSITEVLAQLRITEEEYYTF